MLNYCPFAKPQDTEMARIPPKAGLFLQITVLLITLTNYDPMFGQIWVVYGHI